MCLLKKNVCTNIQTSMFVQIWFFTKPIYNCFAGRAVLTATKCVPGTLVPRATNAIALTPSLRLMKQPRWPAISPIIAVLPPMKRIDMTKVGYPLKRPWIVGIIPQSLTKKLLNGSGDYSATMQHEMHDLKWLVILWLWGHGRNLKGRLKRSVLPCLKYAWEV